MADIKLTTKRVQINKAQTLVIASIAGAAFITVFSLIASKALLDQRSYQAKVIDKKETALKQLKENIDAVSTLNTKYKAFIGNPQNIIGGSSIGTGDRDGDNARIVLDALPSRYDFPALATSIDKLINGGGFKASAFSGSDDEVSQAAITEEKPVEIPFQVSLDNNYQQTKDALSSIDRTIRPIKLKLLSIAGTDKGLNMTISALTYYQPSKTLTIKTEVVK